VAKVARSRFTDAEWKHHEKGLCAWQTATYPRLAYCSNKRHGALYCAKHERQAREYEEYGRLERPQRLASGGGAKARTVKSPKSHAPHARKPAKGERTYDVKLRGAFDGPDPDLWRVHGTVILKPSAGRIAVEAALSQIGIYMPRGADTLTWSRGEALIREYGKEPAVKLIPRR